MIQTDLDKLEDYLRKKYQELSKEFQEISTLYEYVLRLNLKVKEKENAEVNRTC